MKFTKDVLYPDTYHLPDGRVLTLTPDETRSMGKRMGEMLSAGLQIPVAWEHQPDAVPMTAEERARAAGKAARDLQIGFVEKGFSNDQGVVQSEVDIPVKADADRIPANRFVSPGIRYDWKDGSGTVWPGPSIVHLAVTPRPIQHKQKAFKPVAMSHKASGIATGSTFCLSLYGEAPMADDKETKKKDDEGQAKGVDVKSLLKLLSEAFQVTLPDDTTEDNLLDRLRTVAIAKKPPEPETETTTNQPGPISMSHNQSAVEKRLIQMGKTDLGRRLTALHTTGRINKPIHDKLATELKTVNLSLTSDGSFAASPVESKISAYEELPAGNAFNLGEGAVAAQPPAYAGTEDGPKATAEKIDQFFALTGSQQPAKK